MKKAIYLSLLTLLLSSCGQGNEKIMVLNGYEECQNVFHLNIISPLDGWYKLEAEFLDCNSLLYRAEYFLKLSFEKSNEIEGAYKTNIEYGVGETKTFQKYVSANYTYDYVIYKDTIYEGFFYHREELIRAYYSPDGELTFRTPLDLNKEKYRQNIIEWCYNSTDTFKEIYQGVYDSLKTFLYGSGFIIELSDSDNKKLEFSLYNVHQINYKYSSTTEFSLEDKYSKISGQYNIEKISEEIAPKIVIPNNDDYPHIEYKEPPRKYLKLFADVFYV